MNSKSFFILMIIISLSFPAFSQKEGSIELKTNFGEVMPHRVDFPPLTNRHTYGVELNYLLNCKNNFYYNSAYNFPTRGYGISYMNLRNREVLGEVYSIYSFLEIRIAGNNKFYLNIRPNVGLSYLTNKYDKFQNPDNIAIGSNINFYFNFEANALYKINNDLNLRFGSGLLHYSNGSSKKPNLGLNQLYLSLGLSKLVITKETKLDKKDLFEKFQPHEFWLMGTISAADEYSKGYNGRDKLALCSSLSAGYNYQYSGIGKIGVSLDFFYNENLKRYYHPESETIKDHDFKPLEIPQIGSSFGHHLIFRNFELINFIGIYYYNKTKPHEHLYMRIGARYYFTDNFFVNLSLKSIGFKAQYIEPGLGFSLKGKNYKYAQTRAAATSR